MSRILALVLCVAVTPSFLSEPAGGAEKPNILFIMSDDHAFQAMSCYGSRVNQTPNLDRIARPGLSLIHI